MACIMNNLNSNNIQTNSSYRNGMLYSLLAATVLNLIIAFVMIVTSIISGNFKEVLSIILYFAVLNLFTSIVVFIYSFIIGLPVIKLLELMEIDTRINAAIAGGISVLLFSLFLTKGNIYPPFLIMSVYGIFSGFGLMHGYKNGTLS